MKTSKLVLYISVLLLLCSCKDAIKSTDESTVSLPNETNLNGTQQMIDSITAIKNRIDFRNHPHESAEKLIIISKEAKQAFANNTITAQLYYEYGLTLLDAGKTEEAITIFTQILKQMPDGDTILAKTKPIYENLALSYLRLGEQVNCSDNHTPESCLFPIQGTGIHTDETGSRNAITIYKKILQKYPEDLRSQWLLNVAYMTVGEYPDKIPAAYRIDPKYLKSEYDLPTFENISIFMGVDDTGLAGGVITDDFNNDGFIDIIVSSWGFSGNLNYFKNDGNGAFNDTTEEAGLKHLTGGLNLIQADYNNDGYLDFYVLRGAWSGLSSMGQMPNSLIKNNGDGTFTDVTVSSGMYGQHPTQSAVWFDFNVDGWLDLYVGNETHSQQELHPAQLFLNNKNGTFTDVAPKLNVDLIQYCKGVAVGDINNDNLPDIYVSILNGKNVLFLNKGGTSIDNWKFEEISQTANVVAPLESFPTWFFDYDNDGFEDLFVSSYDRSLLDNMTQDVAADYLGKKTNAAYPRLYKNNGDATFTNVTTQANLDHILPTMGCNFGDLDNDGYLDFYLGTGSPKYSSIVPNRMFRNNNGLNFQDVTFSGNFGHLQKGHGIAFADFDNDGDQDIYAVMGGAVSGDVFQNALFENPMSKNKSVTLVLEGTTANRSAIGAQIKLTLKNKDGSNRSIYHTVNSGGSFGANSLQAEIGLGEATTIETLEINWPNGKQKYISYGSVSIQEAMKIYVKEGSTSLKYETLKSTPFKKNTNTTHHIH